MKNRKNKRFIAGLILLIISLIVWLISIPTILEQPGIGLLSVTLVTIIPTIIGIMLIYVGRDKMKVPKGLDDNTRQKEEDRQHAMNEIKAGNISVLKFEGIESHLIMQRNEEIVLIMPHINFLEHSSVNQIYGGGGISLPFIGGVGLTSGIHSEVKEEMRVLDTGKLTLTNKRLVFDGEKRSGETILSDIIAIVPYKDGIGVKSRAREKVQYFVITKPKDSNMKITYNERIHEESINGEWLAAIIEGAIKSSAELSELEEEHS